MKVKNLKTLRKMFRLSRQELANLLGCTATAVTRWEREKSAYPSVRYTTMLADLYGVSTDVLFDRVSIDIGLMQKRKGD